MEDPNKAKVALKRKDVPKELHPVCDACILRSREKYNNFTTDDGTFYEDGFGCKCSFIPHDENFFSKKLKSQITPEEWNYANSFKSALLWGEANLIDPDTGRPWRAWPYQRGPLLCKNPRKAYRFGRRCLPAGTPILMANGSWKPIELVKPGERIVSRNKKAQNVGKRVLNFWENGEKEIFRVTLTNGMSLECTSNHPFLTYIERDVTNHRGILHKWMSIEDGLEKGMKVAILSKYDKWGNISQVSLAKLLGYLLTDGYIVGGIQTPKFTNNNRQMIDEVQSLSRDLFGYECSICEKGNGWDIYITDSDRSTKNKLSTKLSDLGLLGRKSANKIIPNWIYSWDKESVMALINRMFSGDGGLYCHQKQGRKNGEYSVELSLSSTSKEMLETVQLLLFKIGVQSYINKDGNPNEDKGYVQRWKLKISSKDSIYAFFENVGLIFGKEDRCIEILEAIRLKARGHKGVRKYSRFISIKSIESIGRKPTYDIEVEDTHNMVSRGIYTHNTGKSVILSVEILWWLFTSGGGELRDEETGKVRQNIEIMVLAPQKVHIDLIFSKMRMFISLTPSLAASIDRNKQGSPQLISVLNSSGMVGNRVGGFASGDSSGSKGIAARGQSADLVILDEGAYVGDEVLEGVIHPILYTRPTTKFIISSTPSGIADDYFERVCKRRPDFSEFYVPATSRPDWDKVEAQVRRDTAGNIEKWNREVLAEFSQAGVGVYREDLVRFAQSDYEYGSLHYNEGYVYTIGVDWNKEHGTEIVVLSTFKGTPHISWVAQAENIPKEKFSTPFGVERIVELNRIFRASWIYVDAGGGDGGQTLQHHGRMMVGKHREDERLKDIVKSFDFGSKMEAMDGLNKIKVSSKPFMIENSVKKFELGEVRYPRSDLVLTKQLNNYIVSRRSPAGIPIFGMKEEKWGDHRLDALNLALIAVRIEFPSFTGEGINLIHGQIGFIPPKEIKSNRVILPTSTAVSRPFTHRSNLVRPNVIGTGGNCWGKIPSDEEAEAIMRRRSQSISGRFGR